MITDLTDNNEVTGDNSAAINANTDHRTSAENPHNVTKTQIGLSNVDNTADIDKPISNAVNNALTAKANAIHNHNLNDLDEKSYNSLTDKPSLHEHINKSVIDKFSEDGSGKPLYNGINIISDVEQVEVYDGLDSTSTTDALSANMGKQLKDNIDVGLYVKEDSLGLPSSDGQVLSSKINGIRKWVNVRTDDNVNTNLSISDKTAIDLKINSSTGTDITLSEATNTEAGLLSATKAEKIDSIDYGANVNNITNANANLLTSGNSTDIHFHDSDRNRENHTGTQLSSTISDLQNTIETNPKVQANTSKVTNANHTGEVTGHQTLTIQKDFITNKTASTPTNEDYIIYSNTDNSGILYKATISSLLTNVSAVTELSDVNESVIVGRVSSGAGLSEELTPTQVRTLLNVEDGSTADMSASEIKVAYESNNDTNAFTDAYKTKLDEVEQNVQSDYTEDDSNSDSFIKNKPDLSSLHSHSNKSILDNTEQSFTSVLKDKLDGIESGSTADQTDLEIETAYNNQVSLVTDTEAQEGTTTDVKRWSPAKVKLAIENLSPPTTIIDNLTTEDTTSALSANQGKVLKDLIDSSTHLELGETETTAYRGDRGKIAYDHSQLTHDKTMVGLSNVDNTADIDKPISNATQIELDKKAEYYTDLKVKNKPIDRLFVYYGYPIAIYNLWDEQQVIDYISHNFDIYVVGDTYQDPEHESYEHTVAIIQGLMAIGVKVYGYIPIGVSTDNRSISTLSTQIDQWNDIGVYGIFIDEFGFDYDVTRVRQNDVINLIRGHNLPYIANSWSYLALLDSSADWNGVSVPQYEIDLFNDKNPDSLPLASRNENDAYLIENFMTDHNGPITVWDSLNRYDIINQLWEKNTKIKLYALGVIPEVNEGTSDVGPDFTKMHNLSTKDKIAIYCYTAAYIYKVDALGIGGYSFGAAGYVQLFNRYYLPYQTDVSSSYLADYGNNKSSRYYGETRFVVDVTTDNEHAETDGNHNILTESIDKDIVLNNIDNKLDTKSNTTHNHNLNDLTEKSYNSLTDKPDLSDLHNHTNKAVIDNFTDDGNGLLYNGGSLNEYDINWTVTANTVVSVDNTKIVFGDAGSWANAAYSDRNYKGNMLLTWSAPTNDKHFMMALNTDPTTDDHFSSLDFALYVHGGDHTIIEYENGTSGGTIGDYSPNDVLGIEKRENYIIYTQNGKELKKVELDQTQTDASYYVDSSAPDGAIVENISFKTLGNNTTDFYEEYVSTVGFTFSKHRKSVTSGTGGIWTNSFYSKTGYVGNVKVSYQPAQLCSAMIGLDTNPSENNNHDTIGYTWYMKTDGILEVRSEGSILSSSVGSYAINDTLAIEKIYDEIRFLVNGELRYVVSGLSEALRDGVWYLDSSMDANLTFNNVSFIELGSIDKPFGIDNKVSKVSSTDNAVVRFDGTTGEIQDSGVIISDNGYIKLGSDAPAIKMKKITGTTSDSEGGDIAIDATVSTSKILSVDILVEYTTDKFVKFGTTDSLLGDGYYFDYYIDNPNIHIKNASGNSSNILSKPVRVLITYEE